MSPQPITVKQPTAPSWLRWLLMALLGAAVIVAGVVGYRRWAEAHALPDGLVQLNGRVEGDTITVGAKVAGRIRALAHREGDEVKAGQALAWLDDAAARARLAQATASRASAVAQADAARAELVLLRKQVPIQIDSARAALDDTDALLEQARVQEAQAGRDLHRVRQLFQSGSVAQETDEHAALTHDEAVQSLAVARASKQKAQSTLLDARLGPEQIRAKEAQVAALDAAAGQAQAMVDEAQTAVDDLTILAPADGTITSRFVDAGQVISGGTPLFEIVDLDHLYLKAYVPDSDVGKVRLGARARIFTDAFPDRPFEATVRYVASRAEFTPKEVQTRDERVKLVYAAKLYVDGNADRRLVPGLSADALVRWRDGVAWATPR